MAHSLKSHRDCLVQLKLTTQHVGPVYFNNTINCLTSVDNNNIDKNSQSALLVILKTDFCREWKKLGLSQAPPPLTESEKRELVKKWQEQNLWNETMTGAELKEFTRVKKVRQQTDKK